MPLKIDVGCDFDGFGVEKWSQVGTEIGSKTDVGAKAKKNQLNASRLAFSWLSGVQLGYPNGSKIDKKSIKK